MLKYPYSGHLTGQLGTVSLYQKGYIKLSSGWNQDRRKINRVDVK